MGSYLRCIFFLLLAAFLAEASYESPQSPFPVSHSHSDDICQYSKFPDFCHAFLNHNRSKGALALEATIQSKREVQSLLRSCKSLTNNGHKPKVQAALKDCEALFQDAEDLINECLAETSYYFTPVNAGKIEDMQTWMSGALTDYETCMDGLKESGGSDGDEAAKTIKSEGSLLEKSISTSLTFLAWMRHGSPGWKPVNGVPPGWLRRRLLQTSSTPIIPNITVAKDGSGQFTSVSQAIAAAPAKVKTRFVIYVKQGTYTESFEVPKNKTNLMLIGDGIRKTIITGNKSVQDPGVTTFTSATVIISGNNFLGQSLTIQNTAGAANHQAVALRVTADQVAFYKCSFEGFQDTLYAHSLRQFYIQCRIYGTIDFIFGNAAAVFLNSELVARIPLSQQQNTFTAQGRTDPNQNTGFSFQNCSADGNADLKSVIQNFPTYLGRPWKEYSLTVFLRCYEGDVIHPAGWLEWNGSFALKTLFYGEYLPRGPGSGSSRRVSWSTRITNQTIANMFSARNLLGGQDWIPQTNFPFQLDVA